MHVFFVSNLTANWKYALTQPTAPTSSAKQSGNYNGNNNDAAAVTLTNTVSVDVNNSSEKSLYLSGYIVNGSNAGSLTLTWAQDTSDAGNTVVKAGSCLRVYEV